MGEPTAKAFQLALVLIVVGGVAIGWAGRDIRSRPRILNLWWPSLSLFVSCGFFLIASQVTCTAGCPVPYGPHFTWPDFIHTTSAVIAFAAACWTIFQCAFAVGHRALRLLSLIASISVAVIAGAGGLMSLLDWNANFGSRLELVATTIGLAWILVFGLVLLAGPGLRFSARSRSSAARRAGGSRSRPGRPSGTRGPRGQGRILVTLPDD